MPEMERAVSNHTMYVFAKEKYLNTLLRSGRITQDQFRKMERFLYERFQIASIDDFELLVSSPVPLQPVIDHAPEPVPEPIRSSNVMSTPELLPAQPMPSVSASAIEYISLTDLAREYNPEDPGKVIQLWMQTQSTVEFLKLWEQTNNPQFNLAGYEGIQERIRGNSFTLTAKSWIEQTGATGIQSKPGRYGGTFAHPVIACEFLTNLSPRFKLALIEMRDVLMGQAGDSR